MGFLTPIAFAGLISLPIILLLYMMRKKTTPRVVSSILLWKRLDKLTSSALNINKILKNMLLFLQLLLALLLVLSLARPVLLGIGQSTNDSVIIIDTSISMAVVEDGQSRLDKAIEQLESQIDKKKSNTKLAIIAAGNQAEIIIGLTSSKNQLLDSLEYIHLSTGSPNIEEAFLMAESMTEDTADLDIILISDGNFEEVSYPIGEFEFIHTGNGNASNLYIENVIVDNQRLSVLVGNNGSATLKGNISIYDHLDNRVGSRLVELEPQARQNLIWRNLPGESLWFKVEVESQGDQLLEDNIFYSVNTASKNTKALLITEGNVFLEKALLLSDALTISKVQPDKFHDDLLDKYDIYIFDGFLPQSLPSAPVLIFDPPYPNKHFSLSQPVKIDTITPGQSELVRYVDFSDVTIHFSKVLQGGRAILSSTNGNLVVELENAGYPMVVFGFPVQGGDFHLRPAFPIMLINVMDFLMDYQIDVQGFSLYNYPTYSPPLGVQQLTLVDPSGANKNIEGTFPIVGEKIVQTGVYTLKWMENTMYLPVNHPRTGEGLSSRENIKVVGARDIEGNRGKRNFNLTWILLLLALVVISFEWWVDNYVY